MRRRAPGRERRAGVYDAGSRTIGAKRAAAILNETIANEEKVEEPLAKQPRVEVQSASRLTLTLTLTLTLACCDCVHL